MNRKYLIAAAAALTLQAVSLPGVAGVPGEAPGFCPPDKPACLAPDFAPIKQAPSTKPSFANLVDEAVHAMLAENRGGVGGVITAAPEPSVGWLSFLGLIPALLFGRRRRDDR